MYVECKIMRENAVAQFDNMLSIDLIIK